MPNAREKLGASGVIPMFPPKSRTKRRLRARVKPLPNCPTLVAESVIVLPFCLEFIVTWSVNLMLIENWEFNDKAKPSPI